MVCVCFSPAAARNQRGVESQKSCYSTGEVLGGWEMPQACAAAADYPPDLNKPTK